MQRMNRAKDDRGAVAVWVAVLLIPFLMAAALTVDIGAVHADRQRLQHGAEAAALAIAQDCAVADCGNELATAQNLADAHQPMGGPVTATVPVLEDGWVEVTTTASRDHWFAPVMGQDDITQTLTGAASWGSPSGGRSAIPFAFAACELAGFGVLQMDAAGNVTGLDESRIGQRFRLEQSKVTNTSACTVKPESNNYAPGGFGWLAPDGAADEPGCTVHTEIGETVGSANGNSQGSHDSDCYARLRDAIDSGNDPDVPYALLPVFSTADSPTTAKTYLVAGYIAVTLEGYRFQGTRCYGETVTGTSTCSEPSPGNGGWIVITPQRFISSNSDFDSAPDAPDLGANIVNLELPRGLEP